MARDDRYQTVKILIEGGHIKSMKELIRIIPASVVYKDLGINYSRFKNLIDKSQLFTLQELILLASFCKMEPKAMIDLAYKQYITNKERGKGDF